MMSRNAEECAFFDAMTTLRDTEVHNKGATLSAERNAVPMPSHGEDTAHLRTIGSEPRILGFPILRVLHGCPLLQHFSECRSSIGQENAARALPHTSAASH